MFENMVLSAGRVMTLPYGKCQQNTHGFHIRDEQDFLRIWQYIDTNPAKWLEDKYYVIETMEVNL